MIDWLVLRLKPKLEKRAVDNVVAQGAEFYFPRALVRVPRSAVLRPAPLFPGYAFARPAGDAWVYLKSTIGVADVMMSTGEHPARLRAAEIEKLRAREDSDGFIRLNTSQFKAGERVRIADDGGVLADFAGVIDEGTPGRDRVFVLLGILGRQARVAVDVGRVVHD